MNATVGRSSLTLSMILDVSDSSEFVFHICIISSRSLILILKPLSSSPTGKERKIKSVIYGHWLDGHLPYKANSWNIFIGFRMSPWLLATNSEGTCTSLFPVWNTFLLFQDLQITPEWIPDIHAPPENYLWDRPLFITHFPCCVYILLVYSP